MNRKAQDPSIHESDRSDRWARGTFEREELAAALLAARVAGEDCSHDRGNVLWKIKRLVAGDPDVQFGLTGLAGSLSREEVLRLVAAEAGFDPDPGLTEGPVRIEPGPMLRALEAAGDRLARAAGRGENVLLATGHPAGLVLLYMAVGELLTKAGAKLLRPMQSVVWHDGDHSWRVRYLHGVAILSYGGSSMHSHSPDAMQRMLEEVRPDLVFADHGFAGAAIEAGVETISVVDVNDPAPLVAKHQGRTDVVIVMDDNVEPEDYWPCFQAIAARFPPDRTR